jgi:hypothetical protein
MKASVARTPQVRSRVLYALAFGTPAVVAGIYYLNLFRYSVNFPFFDDFEVILGFLNQYLTRPQLGERLRLLFEQHSEHRLVFDRLVALAQYSVFGELNFRWLIMIGNAALLVTLALIYKAALSAQKLQAIHLLPVPLILFTFRYFETSFWPMAALQNLWVIVFVLLSLHFLYDPRPYAIYLSILIGWLGVFTSANGMMVFIAGAIVLALKRQLGAWRSLAWALCGGLSMGAYFYGYIKPAAHPPIIQPMLNDPLGFAGYALAFLGAGFTENVSYAVAGGAVMVVVALGLTLKRYDNENPVLYTFIVFVLITSATAALARFGFGIGQALSSKYTIYSVLFAICCYIGVISYSYRRLKLPYVGILCVPALFFHVTGYTKYLPPRKAEKETFEKEYALVTQGKISRFAYGWPPMDERKDLPKRELVAADRLGYFKFSFTDEGTLIEQIPTSPEKTIKFALDRLEPGLVVFVGGWAFMDKVDSDDVWTILCFRNEQGGPPKYFIADKIARSDGMSGFNKFFNMKELPSGKHALSLILTDTRTKNEIATGRTVTIP